MIVSGLHKKNQKLLVLTKAVQYKNEEKPLPPQLNIQKLTRECIQYYSRKETFNEEMIREAAQYLESRLMKIRYLTYANMVDDVLQIHIKSKDYKSAYELVLEHAYYDKGVRIAEEDNDEKMACLFQLYSLYLQLSNDSPKFSTEHMQKLANDCAKFPLIQAEVYLLDAKIHHNMDSCINAQKIYITNDNIPGELEAFNILIMEFEKNISTHNEDILNQCHKGNQVLQLFSTVTHKSLPKESKIINQAIQFHHLHKRLHNQYSLPPHLGYWITACKPSPVHMTLSYTDICRKLKIHYETLTKNWLSSKNVERVLFFGEFDIHRALQEASLIPQSQQNSLQKYIHILCSIIDLDESLHCFPDLEAADILLNLYSPQKAISNYAMTRKNLSVIQNSSMVRKVLERKCNNLLKLPDLASSVDKLFRAWRVSLVAYGDIGDLQQLLLKHSTDTFKYTVHGRDWCR